MPSTAPRWTKPDKKRVRKAIDDIAAKLPGGQADIARALELRSRAVVQNWRQRGVIPLEHFEALVKLAPELALTPADVNPTARLAAQVATRAAS